MHKGLFQTRRGTSGKEDTLTELPEGDETGTQAHASGRHKPSVRKPKRMRSTCGGGFMVSNTGLALCGESPYGKQPRAAFQRGKGLSLTGRLLNRACWEHSWSSLAQSPAGAEGGICLIALCLKVEQPELTSRMGIPWTPYQKLNRFPSPCRTSIIHHMWFLSLSPLSFSLNDTYCHLCQ